MTASTRLGDGTIALAGQLDPRARASAAAMSGYGNTPVGILSDPEASKELSRVPGGACASESR